MPIGWAAAATVAGAYLSSEAQGDAADSAANSSREATNASASATAERLAFDRQVYTDGAADRAFASDRARTVSNAQDADRIKYNALQDEQIVRGRRYQGVEDQMLGDAQAYDTPERREAAAAQSRADVEMALSGQRAQSNRELEANGVVPGSGKQMAMQGIMDVNGAKLKAGASNAARTQVQTQGYARKMDAVGLGKGLVGSQATQAALGLSSANASVNNAQVPLNVSSAANSAMSMGLGNAAAGYGALGRNQQASFLASQGYGNDVGSNVGSMFGGLAQRFGGGLNNQSLAGSGLSSQVSGLGSSTTNPWSDYNTGRNGWGNYGE